jgi:hypothetical protein
VYKWGLTGYGLVDPGSLMWRLSDVRDWGGLKRAGKACRAGGWKQCKGWGDEL